MTPSRFAEHLRLILAAILLMTAVPLLAEGDAADVGQSVDSAMDFRSEGPAALPPPLKVASGPLAVLPKAMLEVPHEVEAINRWNAEQRKPVKNGFVRPMEQALRIDLRPAAKAALPPGVVVEQTASGTVAATRIDVDGAWRFRLRLTDVRLPPGTDLWVSDGQGRSVVFGLELLRDGGDLWTPSVEGGTLHLQVRIPAGAPNVGRLGFQVDAVAELFRLGQGGVALLGDAAEEKDSHCLEDAACFGNSDLSGYSTYQQAVAHLQFISGGGGFICSGAMINDADDSSFVPYMLTANHCFSTQAEASTLDAFFDYFASSCGGNAPSLSNVPRVSGADLLASTGRTDSTFIELNRNPTGNTGYLGWTTTNVGTNANLYRISHPEGRPQNFSRTRTNNGNNGCTGIPNSRYIYSDPIVGATAGGSSGSPTVDSNLRIRGQLLGACGPDPDNICNVNNDEVDGRFSEFFGMIRDFLQPEVNTTECVPSDTVMCLGRNERFRVEGDWRDFDGNRGSFMTVPYTRDSGLVWFFNENNIEFLVKILNGCNFNGHFWVFAAATTDVEYTLTVTDTETGLVQTYSNPLGNAAAAITDTGAFETCP